MQTSAAKSPASDGPHGTRWVFFLYAVLLGVILAVPWSVWFGRGTVKFFRDYVDWVDWREDIPFAAILLGAVASIAGLVRGRFYPAVPAVVGGGLFLAFGSMSFGAFPSLIGILGGEGKACAMLLCVLAAGARCARKRRGARFAIRLAAWAGALLVLLVGASLAFTCVQGGAARRLAYARLCQVPPAFDLWRVSVSHAYAVIASGAMVLTAFVAAVAAAVSAKEKPEKQPDGEGKMPSQCAGETRTCKLPATLIKGASRIWPALTEAAAKVALLVSPLYALAHDAAFAGQPDFANFLRFRWELVSAILLFLLIDGLGEVLGLMGTIGVPPLGDETPVVPRE